LFNLIDIIFFKGKIVYNTICLIRLSEIYDLSQGSGDKVKKGAACEQ